MVYYDNKGRPQIADDGKSTRFTKETAAELKAHPNYSKPWSMRKTVKKLAEIDVTPAELARIAKEQDVEALKKLLGEDEIKLYHWQAIGLHVHSLRGSIKHYARIEDGIDGKAVERVVEAKVGLAELLAGMDADDTESDAEGD